MRGRDGRAALAVFLLALVLRAGFVLSSGLNRPLEFPDESLHWQLATNLATRGELVSDDGRFAARTPGYPLFLLPFARLPAGIGWARLAQCVVGACAALVAFGWAREAIGARAALGAGLLVALDPFGVFFCRLLLTESIFTPLALALAWLAWRLWTARGEATRDLRFTFVVAALLVPLGVMVRSSAAIWAAGVALLLIVSAPSPTASLLRVIVLTSLGLACFLPWAARNNAVIGGPAWLGSNGGATLYDGQGPRADGGSRQEHFADELPQLRGLPELEADAILRDAAIKQMRENPRRVVELAWNKLLRTWNPIPNFAEYRRPLMAFVSAAYTLPLLILGVGALLASRGRAALRWSVAWPLIYFTLLHMVYVGSVRYRVPLMPFLAVASVIWIGTWEAKTGPAPAAERPRRGAR